MNDTIYLNGIGIGRARVIYLLVTVLLLRRETRSRERSRNRARSESRWITATLVLRPGDLARLRLSVKRESGNDDECVQFACTSRRTIVGTRERGSGTINVTNYSGVAPRLRRDYDKTAKMNDS